MEAAPVDLGPTIFHSEDSLLPNYAKYVDPEGRPVGRGKYNTEYIMEEARNKGGGFNWAAKLCDDYELNGFDDWFLPSRDELNYMYGNLHMRERGNFRAEKYWSSTANDNGWGTNFAWAENFSNGEQDVERGYTVRCRVRPVRQF